MYIKIVYIPFSFMKKCNPLSLYNFFSFFKRIGSLSLYVYKSTHEMYTQKSTQTYGMT